MSSTKFVFFGPIGKTRWPPLPLICWDIFDFSSKLLNRIQGNLAGNKISTFSTKFVFFGPIGKTTWLPWLLIGWDIFNFSSETAERNSRKLDRKQDLNVLYQVFVFRANRKNKMAALASDWLKHFRLFLSNRWTDFNQTWQEARSQCPLPSLSISCRSEKRMAALASDWLTHFRLLLWNRWMDFNAVRQEVRSQHPLPSLYFSGGSVNKKGCPGQFLLKVAHYTQVHDMWPFGPLVLLSWLKAGPSGPELCILLNRFEVFMFSAFIWVTYGKKKLNFSRNTLC